MPMSLFIVLSYPLAPPPSMNSVPPAAPNTMVNLLDGLSSNPPPVVQQDYTNNLIPSFNQPLAAQQGRRMVLSSLPAVE